MYEGWRISRWDTPVSDIKSLAMVSLLDAGELAITLEDARSNERTRWRFAFTKYPAYRNIVEEHRLELWSLLDESDQRCGWTFIVVESQWIASFRPQDPLLDVYFPTLAHYVISTEDDVIEVLSPEPPRIENLGPAPAGAPPAGKSMHLYYPADKEKIERLVEEVRQSNLDLGAK